VDRQVDLCNRLVDVVAQAVRSDSQASLDAVHRAELLLAVLYPPQTGLIQSPEFVRPQTPLSQDALLVNAPHEPGLASELRRELASADRIDLLCAFIVWSGIRLFLEDLRQARRRGVQVRVITTTYTGTTDQRSLDELASLGAEVRVSYDTRATRLHAKAWLFERNSGFSTAYVGSSNLTHSALHEGLEWNVRLAEASSPELLERFRGAFETYWADRNFEPYDPDRFARELQRQASTDSITFVPIDIHPYPFQEEILRRLEVERLRHGRWRNLLVAATGTGKTVVSAFDFRRLLDASPDSRLLFVAHREEILRQSLTVFRTVLREGSFW
jgi:HKD family nuclease